MQTREKRAKQTITNKEEKDKMRNKKGISLIVLVITIIVMIILAAAVIISLSNNGIINKANEAVDANNLKQVEQIAALAWSEAYIDKMQGKEVDLKTAVEAALTKSGVNLNSYVLDVTDTGVSVKEKYTGPTLGSLITNPKEDYGKKVNYTVKVGDDTYSNWRIFYHNEEYVYLILDGKLETDVALNKGTTVASLTAGEINYLEIYEKFIVGDANKYTLADTVNGEQSYNSQAVAQLIIDYANFGDTTEGYKEYVVGAIGGPTLELLAAGWNATVGEPTMTLTTDTYGYKINNATWLEVTSDELYVTSGYKYWLASPSASANFTVVFVGNDLVDNDSYSLTFGVRPVVCLKSSIPATVGTGDYAFSLTE